MVKHLLEVGYDINKTDQWGRTPLHAVVMGDNENRTRMATMLLNASPRPDLTMEDTEGLTPVRLALREFRLPLVKLSLRSRAGLTHGITAQNWLRAYVQRGPANRLATSLINVQESMINVQERPGEGTEVECLSEIAFLEQLRASLTPRCRACDVCSVPRAPAG
ncbi:hypothetical protein N658DRAFT_295034 [Parathielavia hyrcaniae]|uniref:Uncharacterized protein n=1 Tax=Parathielavia hyrcaniae TaxID=113614 RepID=A0AAN6PT36_9PEZI|nr:hypothetical protein N658DRAFT_295034 [Parathielavia hyrcaniae]